MTQGSVTAAAAGTKLSCVSTRASQTAELCPELSWCACCQFRVVCKEKSAELLHIAHNKSHRISERMVVGGVSALFSDASHRGLCCVEDFHKFGVGLEIRTKVLKNS